MSLGTLRQTGGMLTTRGHRQRERKGEWICINHVLYSLNGRDVFF